MSYYSYVLLTTWIDSAFSFNLIPLKIQIKFQFNTLNFYWDIAQSPLFLVKTHAKELQICIIQSYCPRANEIYIISLGNIVEIFSYFQQKDSYIFDLTS